MTWETAGVNVSVVHGSMLLKATHVFVTKYSCSNSLQGGNVWEKAGVNVSVVYGSMPPEAYRAATGANAASTGKVGTPLRTP
jgi:coproporphyrinogen III oxidase